MLGHFEVQCSWCYNFEPKLRQMIFYISLTKYKRNGVKIIIELKMVRVETRGHGKVLVQIDNLVLCTNEVLNRWIDVWPLNKIYKGSQKAHLAQWIMAFGWKLKELWSLDQRHSILSKLGELTYTPLANLIFSCTPSHDDDIMRNPWWILD